MDRDLFLKESREVLVIGQQFAKMLTDIRDKYEGEEEDIERLADEGDEELASLNEQFLDIFEAINA